MQTSNRLSSLARATLAAMLFLVPTFAIAQGTPTAGKAAPAPTIAPGVPFTAEKIASLLPATVYFQGQTAPLQLRNAGGTVFSGGGIVWVSLVDSSGYSTAVQEKYQFYLVTEAPLRFGDAALPAGAYGGGFVGDHFLVMDLGGHTLAQGPVQTDAALQRPRPLQIQTESATAVKLYLGRRWVLLQTAPTTEGLPPPA